MGFGLVSLAVAEGTVLAHSQQIAHGRLRKGRVLSASDIAALAATGLSHITVYRAEPYEIGEDAAASQLARALVPDPETAGVRLTEASTGRVNLYATRTGVLVLDVAAIEAMNASDAMITLATLHAFARCAPGQMVATIKIISYGVAAKRVADAAKAAFDALRIAPVVMRGATLILTEMAPGAGGGKGEAAVATRLERLGMTLEQSVTVAHEAEAIAAALRATTSDLALLLTASATSDVGDVGPTGLIAAGGRLTRFGMPVDPGNLLFSGVLRDRAVIGLPGCARSPALNGADWVLERTVCGLPPTGAQIAAMGVGGLLKESPARPHPRARSKN